MLIITSPAKTLDLESEYTLSISPTQPQFSKQAAQIASDLRNLNEAQIQKLMHINSKLAELNVQRYKSWSKKHSVSNSRPALHIYKGDIYRQLTPDTYNEKQQQYVQKSLRIISGLYGVLKAYDLMQPYRLEMKLDLRKYNGPKLADYWSNIVTESLNKDAKSENHNFLLNLASKEYAAAVDFKKLTIPVVTVDFKQIQANGDLKTVAILSKIARGLMIEFCIKNTVENLDGVKNFNVEGYKLVEEGSKKLVFAR